MTGSFTPLARKIHLNLPPPSLRDNTADLDRLRRGLRPALGTDRVRIAPENWGVLADRLRAAGFNVTVCLADLDGWWEIADLEPGDTSGRQFGLAVDLGTTTVCLELVDLSSGLVLAETALTNPQTALGEDILTRIHEARGRGLSKLQGLAAAGINQGVELLAAQAGVRASEIIALSLAGNTTMTHLFLGLDPSRICREPYIPVLNRPDTDRAGRLGVEIHPSAPMFVFPGVGAYFGGDVIAGLVSTGLADSDEIGLLADVGTNAEVVVGNRDWLMGCAGAAGPALEGGVARMGRPAGPGAIDRVRIDPETLDPEIRVMGGGVALGLCGSGLIDLVAELYLAGVVNIQGRIRPLRHPRIVRTDEGLGFLIQAAGPGQGEIVFSQVDLDVLLRSKAAMHAILTTLLSQAGLDWPDVATFHVAGTFGAHIDPVRAVVIGLIPDLPLERFRAAGNSSLAGARQALLSAEVRQKAGAVRDRVTYLELNVNQEFMNRFSAAKFIPHTDQGLFPSVPPPRRRTEPRLEAG